MREDVLVAQGKRAGTRERPTFRPRLLLLALAVTLTVVAWGYLVYAAVDFGKTARDGDSGAWLFLALASLGAVACLFIGLILLSRLIGALGRPAEPRPVRDPSLPPGGKRAAR